MVVLRLLGSCMAYRFCLRRLPLEAIMANCISFKSASSSHERSATAALRISTATRTRLALRLPVPPWVGERTRAAAASSNLLRT